MWKLPTSLTRYWAAAELAAVATATAAVNVMAMARIDLLPVPLRSTCLATLSAARSNSSRVIGDTLSLLKFDPGVRHDLASHQDRYEACHRMRIASFGP
jgi:hypothetical protein